MEATRVSASVTSPSADITLRASWGQSFFSPTAFQLFNPPAQNFPQLFDIFSNQTLQPPGGVFQAGTIGLLPEETDSYTAGLVYTPKWLPGFTMTVDFYQMYTKSLIVGAAQTAQLLLTRNSLSLLAAQAINPAIDFNDPSVADVDLDGPGLGIFESDFGGVLGGPAGITRAPNGSARELTPGAALAPTLLAYTPPYLAEKILTSRSALEGERKHVTVLFADLKGSTELIRDLDPEAAQRLLDPALQCMMAAVHRFEGTVNQVLGDGIMALFGAPLAHGPCLARLLRGAGHAG